MSLFDDPPAYQPPPPDPFYEQQKAQAERDKINSLQAKLQGDTASSMARYGSMMSLRGGPINFGGK